MPELIAEILPPFTRDLNFRSAFCTVLVCFSQALSSVSFTAEEQPLMKLFETKKKEKSLYTHSDSEEPPNFYATSTGKPNPDSDKDNKKGILPPVSMAARSSCPQQQGSVNQLRCMIKTLGHNDLIVVNRDKKSHPI